MTIAPAAEKTLQAFCLALAELETPWPGRVESARQAIGNCLDRGDATAATEQIRTLVTQHPISTNSTSPPAPN
ncbi:MAG: hypothetical protein HC838_14555 [Spirulinaceae cyanobacterium RM2_2_10]|nr:hypothetical protein [Spirulinaceae cyanobacterium RM2_2_10]